MKTSVMCTWRPCDWHVTAGHELCSLRRLTMSNQATPRVSAWLRYENMRLHKQGLWPRWAHNPSVQDSESRRFPLPPSRHIYSKYQTSLSHFWFNVNRVPPCGHVCKQQENWGIPWFLRFASYCHTCIKPFVFDKILKWGSEGIQEGPQ